MTLPAVKLSVIVCTFNRCESLKDSLTAILGQSCSADLEIELVVVDNNSRDRTKETVLEMSQVSPWPVRYIFERNQGISFARNRGIREAQGDILAFTDDDTIPEKGWAQAVADAFLEYGADAVSGKILPLWLKTPPEWLKHEDLQRATNGVYAWVDHGPDVIEARTLDYNFFFGANMAFRKAVLLEVGEFRTDMGMQGKKRLLGEETELLQRLFAAGKKMVYTPFAVVWHKVEPFRTQMRYVRHWKFSKGRSVGLIDDQRKSVTPWLIRECAQNGLGSLFYYARAQKNAAQKCELKFWAQLGQIFGILERSKEESRAVRH